MRVRRVQVPETDRMVERGRTESVIRRAERERGYRGGMAFEVAQVKVIVRGEVADRIVCFR